MHTKYLPVNIRCRVLFRYLGINGTIILKWIVDKM
jgi:hypothetical protein